MNTKFLLPFILAVSTAMLLNSCDKQPQREEPAQIIGTNVQIPATVEIEEGQSIDLTLRGKTNITAEDQIILRSASNYDYPCPIVLLEDGRLLRFQLPEGISSGSYKVYVRRSNVNHYLGSFSINILKPLNVEPGPGINVYGIVTCDGKGVPGVLVSDGAEFARTDENGIYQLKSEKKWKYVFMVIPSGYEVPAEGVLPRFHAALSQNVSVPERKDFELVSTSNDRFNLLVLGDMHLANRTDDIKQFNQFSHTVNEVIDGFKGKTYAITLGDMTWDLYWYSNSYQFPQYLATVNQNFKNIQFFHTMGNHDNDMNSVGDYDKAFQYTRDLAPTFYSFNLGKIHFIVLDNIDYNNVGTGSDLRSQYKRNYTAEQMTWLAKDLSYVDPATPVFITSHAPVSNPSGATGWNDNYLNGANSPGEANMTQFLSAVSSHNVHFLSGHTHNIFNRRHSPQFEEHNSGAVCASWWWSGHLTEGLHLSQDGAPGGFGIWEFNGTSFSHSFRAAGHDENYQFRAYDMNRVKDLIVPSLGGNHKDFIKYSTAMQSYSANAILVNVWDYDPDWTVSISENGRELNVTPVAAYDPAHIAALSAPRCKSAGANSTPSFLTSSWNHFFLTNASSANSTVVITVKDRNGKTYTETMTRPKTFTLYEYKNK